MNNEVWNGDPAMVISDSQLTNHIQTHVANNSNIFLAYVPSFPYTRYIIVGSAEYIIEKLFVFHR
jgi:hypothetical protein